MVRLLESLTGHFTASSSSTGRTHSETLPSLSSDHRRIRISRTIAGSGHNESRIASSSHGQRKSKDLLSCSGHSVSSMKSFASASTDVESVRGDSRLSEPPSSVREESRPSDPPHSVFVGRTKHLDRLVTEFKSEETRFVIVHGPAGCGKTWLIEEFRRVQQVEDQNTVVLYSSFARVSPYEDPLAPIWQALAPFLGQCEDLVQAFSPLLSCILPHLCPPNSVSCRTDAPCPPRGKAWENERLEAHLIRLLRRFVSRNPREREDAPQRIIWCLDDLGDASPEALRLLQTVLLKVDRILFLGTCLTVEDNSSALARWLVHLKRHKLKTSAMIMRPVSNLSLKNIIHLIERQYLPQNDADERKKITKHRFCRALAKQVEGYTEGNALTVSQLLRLLQDLGGFPNAEIPDSPNMFLDRVAKLPLDAATCLQQVVRLRLRALPEPAKYVLRIASAYASYLFSADALYCLCRNHPLTTAEGGVSEAGSPMHPGDVQNLLRYAARVGFLACSDGDDVYGFVHPLVRNIVFQTLSGNTALRVHYELGLVFHDILFHRSPSSGSEEDPTTEAAPTQSQLLDSRGVSHWNHLLDASTGQDHEDTHILTEFEVTDLAIWNHRAASQASRRQSWLIAAKHLETAVSLLDKMSASGSVDSVDKRDELWLEWTCQRIPVELACGHYDVARELATQVRRTRTTNGAYVSSGRSAFVTLYHRQSTHGTMADKACDKSIDCCFNWLRELGDSLPDLLLACSSSPLKCIEELLKETKAMLVKFDFKSRYRPSGNADIQYRMRALEMLADVSALRSPSHHTVAMLRGLQLSVQHGRFTMTPLCFAVLADVLAQQSKWGSARQYADMALEMAREGLDTEMDTRTIVVCIQLATVWGDSGSSSERDEHLSSLNRYTEVLLWASSWTVATFSKLAWFWSQFSSCSLRTLLAEAQEFLQVLDDARQGHLVSLVAPFLDLVQALQQFSKEDAFHSLEGSCCNDSLHRFPDIKRHAYMCRMISSFWKNDASQACTWLDLLSPEGDVCMATCVEMRSAISHPTLVFLQGLIAWVLVAEQLSSSSNTAKGTSDTKKMMKLCHFGESFTQQLETWEAAQSRYAGREVSGKATALLKLLRAQDEAGRQQFASLESMLSSYEEALAAMERANVGQGLVAISLEQAGLCLRRLNNPAAAGSFLQRSLEAYREWGALGKVQQLEQLLYHTLEPNAL